MTAQQARLLARLIEKDRRYRLKCCYQTPVAKKDLGVEIGKDANKQTADSLVAVGLAEVLDFEGKLYVCLRRYLGN